MVVSKTFEQLEVYILGEQGKSKIVLSPATVDLTVEGRYSLVNMLSRGDVSITVDVTGLAPGTYTLPISLLVRDEKATSELTSTLSATEVSVTIPNP